MPRLARWSVVRAAALAVGLGLVLVPAVELGLGPDRPRADPRADQAASPPAADPTPAESSPAESTSTRPRSSARAPAAPVAIDLAHPLRLEPVARPTLDGFRMEGAAELPLTIGDSTTLQVHVDRFYTLHARLDELRRRVSRHAAAVLAALPEGARFCPGDVAVPYFRAHRAGQRFESLGADLETSYRIVRRLDELGESAGLTPDYRWKIARAHDDYQQVLVDHAEMRAAVGNHLHKALRLHRCNLQALLRQGAAQAPGEFTVTAPLAATRVTFFVDNRACASDFELYVDGVLLGRIDAQRRAAFQSEAGPHALCLIDPRSEAACGDPGTLRMVHVYEGWSMTTHCQ